MGSFLIGLLGQIASLISGTIGGSINMVTGLVKEGFHAVMKYNQEGIALARQMGMNAQEAQAYTQVLITRAKELGREYGITAEQVLELQKNLSNSTGRALMLNNEEAERMVQINKLVGADVSNQFTSEMMNHMGAQLSTVQGAVSKAYATAAKSGLNAAKFSETVAKNLSLANKLSFRDGVNGIIRMTALSEKLGFNLQSVESAANKFMDLDSAIESSAHLQMLGGAAGAYGSNPLTMAYEANYDPEAFTKRMTNTLGGYATFDAKTGMANVNGMNRDFVKGIAQAMGISMDEAMSIAKKQAEVKYKESAYGAALGNLSTEQRDFVMNKSYVENGRLMINDASGNKHDITDGNIDQQMLAELQKFDNMSEKQIMETQAKTLTSIEEKIDGYMTSFTATIAQAANDQLPLISRIIDLIGNDAINELAPVIGDFIRNSADFIRSNKETLLGIYNTLKGTVIPILKFMSEHIEWIVGFWLGKKLLGWLLKLPWGGNTIGGNLMKKLFNRGGGSPAAAANKIKAVNRWLKGSSKGAAKVGKLIKGGGIATAAVSSVFAGLDMNDYKKTMKSLQDELEKGRITQEEFNKQAREAKNKKNEALGSGVGSIVGGVAGSFLDEFLGPFGTILGAMIGDFLGGLVGKAWNSISNTVSDFWNGTVRDIADKAFGKAGTAVVDAVSEVFDGLTTGFGTLLEGFFGGIGTFLGGLWDGIKTQFKGWTDGLTQIFQGDFVGGLKTIFVGQMKGIWQMLEGTVKGVWEIISAPFLGAWEAWKGVGRAVGKLWDGVVHYFNKAGEGIRKGWDSAMNGLSSLWGRFKTGLLSQISPENKEKIKAAIQNISEKWDTLTKNVSDLWHSTIETISNAWNDYVVTPAKAAWDAVTNVWNEYVATPAKAAWDTITNAWDEYVARPAKAVWDVITNAWNEYVVAPWTKLTDWIRGALQPVFDFFDSIWKAAKSLWEKISNFSFGDAAEAVGEGAGWLINKVANFFTGHANGGIVGGNSYSGDKVLTRVNSGEMILNSSQQSGLFSFISNMPSMLSGVLTNSNDVKAKPVGEREYIYTPSNNNVGNGVTEVTVRDINVNVNGTLKLDTGGFIKDLDVSQLLNDTSFVSQLKELIKQSINNDINGGRFMNDNAVMRGMPAQTTLWGRK